jgi:hypothetical protein
VPLALIFSDLDRYTHAMSRLYSFYRTFHPQRTFIREPRAKAGADPQHIVRLDEHPVLADISRARSQPGGTPLDLQRGLIPVPWRSPPLLAASFCFAHFHGNGTFTAAVARKGRSRAACLP